MGSFAKSRHTCHRSEEQSEASSRSEESADPNLDTGHLATYASPTTTAVYPGPDRPAAAANSSFRPFFLLRESRTAGSHYQADSHKSSAGCISQDSPGIDRLKGRRNRENMQRELSGLYLFRVDLVHRKVIHRQDEGFYLLFGRKREPARRWPGREETSFVTVQKDGRESRRGYRHSASVSTCLGRCRSCW
jgi:hypothetical protein